MIKDFFNGLAFGVTQIVPGVSGGTIAILLGFYDKLIKSINNLRKDFKNQMKFILPFGIGIVVGILALSSLINYLLEEFSFPTMLFFIGLIVGIIPLIFMKVKTKKWFSIKEMCLILIPLIILVIISHVAGISVGTPQEAIENMSIPFMFFIFIAGFIAATGLILPGVSGSFFLLLLGVYPLATYSVSTIRLLLTDITNFTLMLDILKVLGPMAIGILIGVFLTAKLVEGLLERHFRTTYLIILGLLIGSTYVILRDPIVYQSGTSNMIFMIGSFTFIVGFVISYLLGKKKV